ncbi:MAG: DUF424 family protein [Candidatus Diapherotrites archaeon]|uniref:DUF424 family protein n=1 Tax=Candidatus Iainarchaeum sp. TaxID=3101447 RepID=A0A8T4KUS1_9ARCH|nr:MAG: hypothetical protein QT12_C0026G0012 [archaeon GW2011_AR21]MBS3057877.1 DUF424 family protein [Candidatus Diapherotrites archaeon]
MFAKVHKHSNGEVLACCDKELLGKTLQEGEITFEVRESFYKGFEISEEKLGELLKEAENANLVGEKVVRIALKKGLINEKSIKLIKNVPHVQIYKL